MDDDHRPQHRSDAARGSALEEAYAAHARHLLAYLTRLVGPADAEDVLQRTFLDAWRSAPEHEPRRRLIAWLFTVAQRRAIDHLRSRRAPAVSIEHAEALVGEDGRRTADRLADAAEVRSAVALLPRHEREVIELTYFGGLTQREVADRLAVPLGTVKARASRGTRRLAALMGATLAPA